MNNKLVNYGLLIICLIIFTTTVSAETLVLNLNSQVYSTGESAKVFGYTLDDNFGALNSTPISIYYDGTLVYSGASDINGYFEYYINNVSIGSHNVTANTSQAEQFLTFSVVQAKPTYQIIASSLVVPFSNPVLNFTVNEYEGLVLTSNPYNYTVFYENGSTVNTYAGISGVSELLTLPSVAGTYTIIVNGQKSFTVSVAKFTLKFKITDSVGNLKDTFKPGGIAYFEVEGYSNGQRITNATVTAKVTDPAGTVKTVSFAESNGIYNGNTNVTQTGTPIQLRAGEYNVEFIMRDRSNNEQKVFGFFKVLGLNVDVDLVDKKPYVSGEVAEFDLIVKDLTDGTLLDHDEVTYFFELEQNGKFYDVSSVVASSDSDPTTTSVVAYTVPASLEDGAYFLRVKAVSSGKSGSSNEYFEVSNTQLFMKLTDYYDGFRDIFNPGESAKVKFESNTNLSFAVLEIYNRDGVLQNTYNVSISSESSSEISFNVPQTTEKYRAKLTVTTSDGNTVVRDRWFSVQNYQSFMDMRNLNNEFQFGFQAGENFLGHINVFDIVNNEPADLTGFTVKIDKLVNEENQKEYANVNAIKNNSLSDEDVGILVYKILPPSLDNGIYRVEYTLVDTAGKSFNGEGWFGISAFDVDVSTYGSNGQRKEVFASGESINISIQLSTNKNGTARLHRDFYPEATFEVINGKGSVVLSSTASSNSLKLPSESGFYGFGIDVETDDGESGLGNGFFEIRNLNFRSINVRNNGKFAPGDNIIADVTIEKQGSLVNQTNVTVARVFRASDFSDVTSRITDTGAALTDQYGVTTITLLQNSNLEPGEYFVELQASKGTDLTFGGFGFRIVEDKIIVTINDADKQFSQTDNIEINVKVTHQNDTPKSNVTVNLTGLMNFNTWAPVAANKQATTASNGVATITVSAANYNPGRYAPILSIQENSGNFIGFGSGEFEIKPFDTTVFFTDNKESYSTGETIYVNISVTGDATVTTTIKDITGNTVSGIDYYYSNNLLTINNELTPGPYFADVSITQSGKTVTKTLWFDVIAPWMQINPPLDPTFGSSDTININYTVFTNGVNGINDANGTINITTIENMWTGEEIPVGISFNGEGNDIYSLDLTSYALSSGDYLLNFEILENPEFTNNMYFRIDNNVRIFVETTTNSSTRNATINFTINGLNTPDIWLEGYWNYQTWEYTDVDPDQLMAFGGTTEFQLTNLENGFYEANFRINESGEVYYWNAFFDIRYKDVQIDAPEQANVNEMVQFNITSSLNRTTNFWILDPFTGNELLKRTISPGLTNINYTFDYNGNFVYSYGDTKWDAFPNGENIRIIQSGFNVNWPHGNNRYVLTDNRNFTFNVSSTLANASLTLTFKNLFTGTKTIKTDLTTAETSNQNKIFSYSLNDLNLTSTGPHDIILELDDGSTKKPKEYFFIDIYPDNYEAWAWTTQWEYQAGNPAQIQVDIYNITDNWQPVTAENIDLAVLKDIYWSDMDSSRYTFTTSGNTANITTDNFETGNYHAELNVTIGGTPRIIPVDFFVKGNDNLEVFWDQAKWDYSTSENYTLIVKVRDAGQPVSGVQAQFVRLETRPENWDDEPTQIVVPTSAYSFTPENQTATNGSVEFKMDLSQIPSLETGGYTGRLLVGGQTIWFDFQVRTYAVDAYTTEWEYGITDTIELNARARNIDDWQPIEEDGNIQIEKILKHEPGTWEPQEIPISAFGLTSSTFDVTDGEALIELQPNASALLLDNVYEFEIKLKMNLTSSGVSNGWSWFRLSNGTKPNAQIIDGTGSVPDVIFGGQSYTLQLTGATNATLRNIWGPNGKSYNEPLINTGSALELNFTTPQFPGWYTMEIEIIRSEGFSEFIYEDFIIGSGTEMTTFMPNGENIIPEINFTVVAELFGESDEDPFCPDCNSGSWFGPLANKTITLVGIKDLQTFQLIDVSHLGINQTTNDFPDFMISGGDQSNEDNVICYDLETEEECDTKDYCGWLYDDPSETYFCQDLSVVCGIIDSEQECVNTGCSWNMDSCMYSGEQDMMGGGPGEGEMMGPYEMPGMAVFTLNPTILNLTQGKKYDLVFEYIDDDSEEYQKTQFVQVEQFHVSISKNTVNLQPKSTQNVWVLAADLQGDPLTNCTIRFTGMYDEKNYQLVKTMNVTGNVTGNGTYEFSYITPSLPGQYLVEGTASCTINNERKRQDIAYFIDVGTKSLQVDMKTKFAPGENLKIDITTTDRNGNPISQKLDLTLFHDLDYEGSILPLSGVDCTSLEAAQSWESGGGWAPNSNLQLETNSLGKLVLELCPLPDGEYFVDIFPLMEFMEFNDQREDIGYFQDFIVSSGNIEVNSDLTYTIGDTVTLNITVTNDYGEPINGTLTTIEALLEDLTGFSEIIVYENESLNLPLTQGNVEYSFTIPSQGIDEETENITNITTGPVNVLLRVIGADGTSYSTDNLQFVIMDDNVSTITASETVGVNELIDIHIESTNDNRLKAMMGMFFLKDNTEKEKEWFVEGGVFLKNDSENNKSYADFKILSPSEPGEYYLGMPIMDISASMDSEGAFQKILITPITVKVETQTVNGTVHYLENNSPVYNAKIKIGKAEVFTNAQGQYSVNVAKGFKQLILEKKMSDGTKYFVKSDNLLNITQDVSNLTVYIYDINMDAELNETIIQITPSTNLTTKKILVTTTMNNTGNNFVDLDNSDLSVIAASEELITTNVTLNETTIETTEVTPENITRTEPYKVLIQLKKDVTNEISIILQNSQIQNATISALLEKEYEVNSSLSGGIIQNYCGDGRCAIEEISTCSIDCSGVTDICGDGNVTGSENCDGQNVNGMTCSNFGYTSGTLGCIDDCRGWNFSQCVWETPGDLNDTNQTNETQELEELIINNANTVANDTHMLFEFQIENLSNSPYCNGTSITEEEFEEWVVGINSTNGGCDDEGCWLEEDYAAIISVNSSGYKENELEYWNGSSMTVNESKTFSTEISCQTNQIFINILKEDIGITCGVIQLRYETWYGDDSTEFYNIQDSLLDSIGITCEQEPLPQSERQELNITNAVINKNDTTTEFQMTLQNLSTISMCGGENLNMGSFERWQITFDNQAPGGCNIPEECNGTEDYKLNVEMNYNGTQNPEAAYWNGSEFVTNNTLTNAMDYYKDCNTNTITFRIPNSQVQIDTCTNITGVFATEFDDGMNSTIISTMISNALTDCGSEEQNTINMTVTKTALQQTVENGSVITFVINITNQDIINATNVELIDMYGGIPEGILDFGDEANPIYTYYNESLDKIIWYLNISAGQTTMIEVNFTATNLGNATNNVTLLDNQGDFVDFDEEIVEVIPQSQGGQEQQGTMNLSLSKTAIENRVENGSIVTFIINVTNIGTLNATNFQLVDMYGGIPEGILDFENETYPLFDDYNETLNRITWDLNLNTGQAFIAEVNFTAVDVGNATNNVTLLTNESNVYSFTTETVEIIPGNQSQEPQTAGLSGTVTGSIIENATIEIINTSNMQTIATIYTNNESMFNTSLPPGIYDLFIMLPEYYDYSDIEIEVMGLNITAQETLNVMVPHISGDIYINNEPVNGLVQIDNGTQANISVLFNNSDNYSMNVSFDVNASLIGDTTLYPAPITILGPQTAEFLDTQRTPTTIGINNLSFDFFMDIPQENVLSGTIANNIGQLGIFLNEISFPVNVTPIITGPLSCSGTLDCTAIQDSGNCTTVQNATYGACTWNTNSSTCITVESCQYINNSEGCMPADIDIGCTWS
ncbi:DUF11 domain-containing protein [Candidatus Woesearchaeota archaeon]|nr:DUF11 domain-containing protein [Candidatus Woesearchaeota archaeon]